MSSASNSASSQSTGRKPSAADAARQSLHQHLKKTASFIRLMDTLGQLFAWIAGVLGLWLFACLVDHWLLPLPNPLRWLFWGVGVLGTVAWVTLYLVPLVFRRVSLVYAAQRIEHLVPEFKNGLISWLELENLPDNGVPRGVMAALAYRARRFIGDQDPSATVDTSPLIKLVATVLLLATLMVVYTMISPKSVGATGQRILMPWSSLASPSRVEILKVKPGSVEITQGHLLEIDVEVRGLRAKEPVFVRYSTTDGQLVDRRQELGAVTEGFRYAGAVSTGDNGVEQELDYWVEAGDAQEGPFRVRLNPLPTVVVESIQLDYPEYTGLASNTIEGGQVAEAVEGTTATIVAVGNQPMKRAVLEINPEVDDRQELIRAAATRGMQVDGSQMSVDWLMQLNDKRENPTTINYRIRGYNQRLEANPSPILHSMSVAADLPPEITLVGPESRILKVAPTSVVEIEVRANDPDYGLSKIKLQVRKNSVVAGETTLLDEPGVIGQQVRTTKLDLRRLDVVPGDRVQLIAAAQDNRHDPLSKQWAPGRALSEPLLLEVVGPQQAPDVPPAEDQDQAKQNQNDAAADALNQEQGQSSDQGAKADQAGDAGGSGDSGGGSQSGDSGEGQPGKQSGGQQSGNEAAGDGESSEQQPGGQSSGGSTSDSSGGQQSGQAGRQADGASSSGESASSSANEQSSNNGNPGDQRSGDQRSGDSNTGDGSSGNQDGQAGSDSQGRAGSQGGTQDPRSNAGASQKGQDLSDGEVIERVQEIIQRGNRSDGQSANSSSEGTSPSASPQSQQEQGQQSKQQSSEGTEGSGEGQQTPSPSSSNPQTDSPSQTQQSDEGQQNGSDRSKTGDQGGQGEANSEANSGSQQESSDESGRSGDQSSQQSDRENASAADSQQTSDRSAENQSGSDSSQSTGDSQSSSSSPSGSEGSQSGSQDSSQASGSTESSNQASGASQGGGETGEQDNQQGSGKANDSSAASQNSSADSGSQTGEPSQDAGADGASEPGNQADAQQQGDSSAEDAGSGGSSSQPQSSGNGQQPQAGEPPATESQQDASQSQGGASPSDSASSSQPGQPSSSAQSSSKQGSASSGTSPNQGRTSGGGASADGGGPGGDAAQADKINQDYADRTTQMVLDYLERQKDQPDPELLKELDWSEEDLRTFVERWSQARDLATSPDEQDREQWKDRLQDLGLRPPTLGAKRGMDINDSFQQMQDSGSRVNYPYSLRRKFEAFQRALQNRNKQ